MTRGQYILFFIDKLVEFFERLGDLIVVIWLIETFTEFEPHPSYWFKEKYGLLAAATSYFLSTFLLELKKYMTKHTKE
ncbi:hypothetical protein PALB_23060 [Pseudoalteromonas luteoviolacea B = ATCC 29581]|nr:hypothetical protein PALB_23060 [Pseudoalteromonas luteoviolacea B = ATCC 29581]